MRRIWAATPNSGPSSSTRTIVAWQQTQHFSPEVSSGGRMRTSSTSTSLLHLGIAIQEDSVGADVAGVGRRIGTLGVRTRVGTRVAIRVPLGVRDGFRRGAQKVTT